VNEPRKSIGNTTASRQSVSLLYLYATFLVKNAVGCLLGTIAICFLCVCPAAAQSLPERLTIKLPDGGELHFRAVYLGIDGNRLFASRRVTLGSRESNPSYKERLTETLISGGFVGNRNGKPDWLYYLGETEVQRCQWNAVMRWVEKEKGVTQRAKDDSKLPQTEVTIAEVYMFVEALNNWMLTNEPNSLPKLRGALAFCRLPTEAEWEFAARSGIKVIESNPDIFDRPHPYGDDPGNYEWYRSNSGNQVQECGSSNIKPNPLGLYDMLGNVEELTNNLFSPEYVQGRFGDFVIRGGNFSSSDVSAARRAEYFAYQTDGKPNRSPKLGFRLTLSTRISSVQSTPQELDAEYDKYAGNNGLTRPGKVGESSPADQAAQDKVHFLENNLARLKSDDERRSQEVSRLELELKEKAAAVLEADRLNRDLKNLNEELTRKEREHVTQHNSDQAVPDDKSFLESQLEQLRSDNKRLLDKFTELQRKNHTVEAKEFTSTEVNKDLAEKLTRKELEITDLKRRATLFDHEIDKNAGRVRAVEKRYLEALMRQASANAYIGLRILKKLELRLSVGDIKRTDPLIQERLDEGSQMVYDYWALVVQIAEQTQADLFPEVKAELADWLKAREKKDTLGSGSQRKALDLIERHVRDARAGRYHRPEDLVKSFPNEPEFK